MKKSKQTDLEKDKRTVQIEGQTEDRQGPREQRCRDKPGDGDGVTRLPGKRTCMETDSRQTALFMAHSARDQGRGKRPQQMEYLSCLALDLLPSHS